MQAEVIPNHVNPNVRAIGQGEAMQRKYRSIKLAAVKPTTVQLTSSVSEWLNFLRHNLLHEPALPETLCIYYLNVT
jgi:hypothetical protein